MFMHKFFKLSCFFLGALSFSLFAEGTGGNSESGQFFTPYPEDGSWFARDGSNTGFFFDIQDGILAGAYFGFDNNNSNTWLIFNGELQPLFDLTFPDKQVGWQLETTLNQILNGRCILNCSSTESNSGNTDALANNAFAGDITLQFDGRSRGRFFVDGGELTDIIPLYFGNPAIISEQAAGLTAQPDLEGTWVVVVGSAEDGEISIAESSGIIEIGEQQNELFVNPAVEGFVLTRMTTRAPVIRNTIDLPTPLFDGNVEIVCDYKADSREVSPAEELIDCFLMSDILTFTILDEIAFVPIQMMSDSRFLIYIRHNDLFESEVLSTAVTRIEAFRVSYD